MSDKKLQIGGQAVIEGVMMRGPQHIATAVRRADGSVVIRTEPFVTRTKTHPLFKLYIIRGFVSLIEMLFIGIKTLNFSASQFELDHDPPQKTSSQKWKSFQEFITLLIALALAFVLFGYVPYKLAELIDLSKDNILFNLFAGSIRIVFFVIYVFLISLMSDIKRVFQYHGAEHKSVSAYESKVALTVENVDPFSTIHPRCGTSFMFVVLIISILIFACIDTAVVAYFGIIPTALIRLLYHLPFLPLIAGISYEFLKLSDKNINHFLVRIATWPGMALQKITTNKPDPFQIEVAIIALQAALQDDITSLSTVSEMVDGEWLSDYCRVHTTYQQS